MLIHNNKDKATFLEYKNINKYLEKINNNKAK